MGEAGTPERIVVLDAIDDDVAERLRALLPYGFTLSHATARDEEHLAAIIADADYAVSGQVAVSSQVLSAATRLKLLHKWGVGVDNLDLDAARGLGITVARTTGSNAVPVAEFTIGLMIGALRNVAHGHHLLRQGEWRSWGNNPPLTLSGKTVGLVGFGAIGTNVARLLAGFECDVVYHKPTPLRSAEEARHGVRYADLPTLLEVSDVVSLHCPLTEASAGLIDRRALQRMKPTAVLVNVARGGVVVESDLVWALEQGEIHSAAVDVYEIEPLPPDSPLVGAPNLTLTPHLAAMAADTFVPTVTRMFDNIRRAANGEALPETDVVVP
ncbi:MAG: 2-hydroxyacid dehydrogenase [Actinomycetota bacterium]